MRSVTATDIEDEIQRRGGKSDDLYRFDRLLPDELSELRSILMLASGQRDTLEGVHFLDEKEVARTRAFLAVSMLRLLTDDERDKLRRRAGLVAVGTPEALEQLSRLPKVTES